MHHNQREVACRNEWSHVSGAHVPQLERSRCAAATEPTCSGSQMPQTLEENRASLGSTLTQGFCSSKLGSDPVPDRVVMAIELRRSPASHLAPALPHHFQLHSLPRWELPHTLRKDVTFVHVKSSSPTKSAGHMQSVQGCSHIRSPLQDCSR